MPRGPRLILDNVCYHIISRGNQKQRIFNSNNEFEKYLRLISKYKAKFEFRIYGWCLMGNHVHMVLESDRLSKVMHAINLSYAQYFKFKYNKTGHIWQDRYKSFVIQKDEYLINCISYIEYNPLRANIVVRPEDYRWSSYSARILGKSNGLLDNFTL